MSAEHAEKTFKKKFKSKTWKILVARYTYGLALSLVFPPMFLDRHYGEDEGAADASVAPASSLAPEVLTLWNLIFSQTLLDAHLESMNYNAVKIPLGKLGRTTISKGFSALKRLADVIDDPQGSTAQVYGDAEAAYSALSSAEET
ncbi:hypothetical protein C8R47DRAFT_1218219 [Mycena vitilis]|nr:hypothetical protein C8R47DRAFT_1218219 [Mycena vitilis]